MIKTEKIRANSIKIMNKYKFEMRNILKEFKN